MYLPLTDLVSVTGAWSLSDMGLMAGLRVMTTVMGVAVEVEAAG